MKPGFIFACALLLCATVAGGSAQSWNPCGTPGSTDTEGMDGFAVHNGTLYAANFTNRLLASTDEGRTWEQVDITGVGGQIRFIVPAGDRLYLCTFEPATASGSVYVRQDGSGTWTTDTVGAPNHFFGTGKAFVKAIHYWDGHLVATFDNADAFYSKGVDDEQWIHSSYLAQNDPADYASRGNTLFVAGNKLRYTTDHGVTWSEPANSGLPAWFTAERLVVTDNRIYMSGTVVTGIVPDTLYYSDDMGESWQRTAASQYLGTSWTTQLQQIRALYARGNDIWLGLDNDARDTRPDILRSADGGATFAKDTTGLPVDPFATNAVQKFDYHNGRIYALLIFGDVYWQPVGPQTSVGDNAPSADIVIAPNPASDHVVVRTGNATPSRFALYDLHGRLLQSADGADGTATFDTDRLPAGMYFIEIHGTGGNARRPFIQQ